ncbi:hypothetical protein N665_0791s0030 [Sinapis alba]|nr:hypothetical protein N665_0791s0030 [Sinapis alba]
MKSIKRKRPSTRGGVSTRARKANSNRNEPIGEEVVHQEISTVRDTSVVSLSLDSEREDMSGVSSQARQPPQPLEFYFKSTEYMKTCKIQTKCYVSKTVDLIKTLKVEVKWFTSHPQFHYFFHMPDEQYLKLQGMWMLFMRTICTEEEDIAWFAVNGVPIRYSMNEHALISDLDCHEYPIRYLKLGSTKFVDYYFGGEEKITIKDVEQNLLSMKPCNDRLKMAVLFFLGRVIRGKPRDTGPLDPFILRIVDDLDVCRTFSWGRLTFEDAIKEIKHMMELLKGEVHDACRFPGFVIPLEVLIFEYIPKLEKIFRLSSDSPCEDCPRMCKSRFTKNSMRGYPLEDIYAALGKTKELYESDIAAQVFTKKKEKEKITLVQGSSSTSGLELSLKGLEERLLVSIGQGFSGRCGNKTESSEEKNEAERRRVKADAAWKRIFSESDNNKGKDDEEKSEEPNTTSSPLSEEAETVAKTTEEESEKNVEEDALEENPTEEKPEEAATPEEEDKKYTEEKKQMWYMVGYKGSEEMPCESKGPTRLVIHARPKVMAVTGGIPRAERLAKMRKAKGKKKAESDGTPKKRGMPKKGETDGTPKKRGIPKKEATTLVACTPREKRKPQWLQSPFTDMKTEDIEEPSKKRKTKTY